jgi:hypothetical protein
MLVASLFENVHESKLFQLRLSGGDARKGVDVTRQQRMKTEEQERRIVDLWQQRAKARRTDLDVLEFYGWLTEHEPALIPGGPGSYQRLRTVLRDYLVEPHD